MSVLKKRIFAVKQSFFGGTTQSGHASAILQNEITVESGGGGRGRPGEGESGGSGSADCLGTSPEEVMLG